MPVVLCEVAEGSQSLSFGTRQQRTHPSSYYIVNVGTFKDEQHDEPKTSPFYLYCSLHEKDKDAFKSWRFLLPRSDALVMS